MIYLKISLITYNLLLNKPYCKNRKFVIFKLFVKIKKLLLK